MADIKIKNIRIRQTNDPNTYDIIVIVEGDSNNQVNSVTVVFNEPFNENPTPTPTTASCTYSSTQENGDKRYTYTPLTFDGEAVGCVYSMTGTMKNNRTGTVGTPETMDVKVEANNNNLARR